VLAELVDGTTALLDSYDGETEERTDDDDGTTLDT
jgi:hypothetical protein